MPAEVFEDILQFVGEAGKHGREDLSRTRRAMLPVAATLLLNVVEAASPPLVDQG
jgi:hypothetical protein